MTAIQIMRGGTCCERVIDPRRGVRGVQGKESGARIQEPGDVFLSTFLRKRGVSSLSEVISESVIRDACRMQILLAPGFWLLTPFLNFSFGFGVPLASYDPNRS